jgi:hypothetical protein
LWVVGIRLNLGTETVDILLDEAGGIYIFVDPIPF